MVEFHVLQCSGCDTFQVHQVGKASKWKCKLCGVKQSIIKVFGKGTGADCRRHVQKLNALRGTLDEDAEQSKLMRASQQRTEFQQSSLLPNLLHRDEQDPNLAVAVSRSESHTVGRSESTKWSAYLESCPDHEPDVDDTEDNQWPDETSRWPKVTTDWSEFQTHNKQFRAQKRKCRDEPYPRRRPNPHNYSSQEEARHPISLHNMQKKSFTLSNPEAGGPRPLISPPFVPRSKILEPCYPLKATSLTTRERSEAETDNVQHSSVVNSSYHGSLGDRDNQFETFTDPSEDSGMHSLPTRSPQINHGSGHAVDAQEKRPRQSPVASKWSTFIEEDISDDDDDEGPLFT